MGKLFIDKNGYINHENTPAGLGDWPVAFSKHDGRKGFMNGYYETMGTFRKKLTILSKSDEKKYKKHEHKQDRCDICLKSFPVKFIHILEKKGPYAFINSCPSCAKDLVCTLYGFCRKTHSFNDEKKNKLYDKFIKYLDEKGGEDEHS